MESPITGLILASASARRVELLKRAGFSDFKIIAADIDESVKRNELPLAYCLRMAKEKAEKINKQHPNNLVLAADTIVVRGRTILPKANNDAEVKNCLTMLSGRGHYVITSVYAINNTGKTASCIARSRVIFKRLNNLEIEQYIKSGEGLGKAGGYAIQGLAECFVKAINGSHSGIVGLPLCQTVNLINGLSKLSSQ